MTDRKMSEKWNKNASYLRVKKWKDWQHYKDREPPWVKLHSKLLRDPAFLELTEQEQWQLVRIWMVASQSSRFTIDEQTRIVPVIANDEKAVRRATASLKRVPLEKFIQLGWLIQVTETDLVDNPVENPANASTALAPRYHRDSTDASTLLEVEVERTTELPTNKLKGSPRPPTRTRLPVDNDHLVAKLLTVCLSSADTGTEQIFRHYAQQLPEASLARVIETTARRPEHERARYANGALQSELNERNAA